MVRECLILSAGRLDWQGCRPMRVDSHLKADTPRATVALASVATKTARELFSSRLAAWFVVRQSSLAPTVGYGTDGQCFVGKVEAGPRQESAAPAAGASSVVAGGEAGAVPGAGSGRAMLGSMSAPFEMSSSQAGSSVARPSTKSASSPRLR